MGLMLILAIIAALAAILYARQVKHGASAPVADKSAALPRSAASGIPAPSEPPNLLRNPSFDTPSATVPKAAEGWTEVWVGGGKIAVVRDTVVFHTAPASLSIGSVQGDPNGDVKAQVAQGVGGRHGGERMRLRGFLKTEGTPCVQVAVQARRGITPLTLLPAVYRVGAGDWQEFDKVITLPEGTDSVGVCVYIEGKGRAWLDDAALVSLP